LKVQGSVAGYGLRVAVGFVRMKLVHESDRKEYIGMH